MSGERCSKLWPCTGAVRTGHIVSLSRERLTALECIGCLTGSSISSRREHLVSFRGRPIEHDVNRLTERTAAQAARRNGFGLHEMYQNAAARCLV